MQSVATRPAVVHERLAYLDNLKTVLIAGIIAGHAVQGYSEFGDWTYQDVREVSLSPVGEWFGAIVVSSAALFLMGLFFLISGLFTYDSLARKGPRRFASDRLVRLGIPLAIYTFLLWPLLEYALFGPFVHRGFWNSVTDTDPLLDNGPMWFVGVLLIYSLGYAAIASWTSRERPAESELTGRRLVALGAGIALGSFLVRLVFPIGSHQPVNLHVWEWPQCLGAFGLGVVAASRGWLRPVPDRLYRRCAIVTPVTALVIAAAIVSGTVLGLDEDVFFGGWRVPALLTALSEGVIAVAGPIWALGWAQRHLGSDSAFRRACARSSYAAFMLQGPVVVGLALALRPLGLPGDVKALLVASFGIAGSFALAWLLVTRTRVGRVL